MRKILLLALVLLSLSCKLMAFQDLNAWNCDFILQTKRIIIPEYPDAFNPCFTRWKDKILMSFRMRDPLTKSTDQMGLIWLDNEFNTIGQPVPLYVYTKTPLLCSRAQDPRLLPIGDTLYVIYNNILNDTDLETRRVLVAKLEWDGEQFYIENPEYLLYFEGDPKNWREKNWTPFAYDNSLFLAYSLNPLRVFLPHPETNSCETISITQRTIPWHWGELRGGTPAIRDGDHYIGIFHSFIDMKSIQSEGKKISHYYMGAYVFEGNPPFKLTHISPHPIVDKSFYAPSDYDNWKPLLCVFPGGLLVDSNYLWVAYGRQDHEIWIAQIDKQKLFESLIPVITNEKK